MYFNETNCRTIACVLFCGLFGLFLLGVFFGILFLFLVWFFFLRVAKMRNKKNMTLFLYLLKFFCAIKKSLITKSTEYVSYVGISRRLSDRKKTHQRLDYRGNNQLNYGNRLCIEWTYCTLSMFLFVRFTYVSMIGTERRTG